MLSRVTRSDAAAPGADTRLVMFEGSSAGKKMVSFTTGGDLLMGRNIIRRWTTDKLDDRNSSKVPIIIIEIKMQSQFLS